MIRTRDFFLYLLMLAFVVLAAVQTGVSQYAVEGWRELLLPRTAEAPTVPAYVPGASNDVSARYAALRERLAAGDGYIEDAPPVFTSVDQTVVASTNSPSTSQSVPAGSRSVQWCSGPVRADVSMWPTNDTSLAVIEGQRVLQSTVTTETTVGTTTTQTTETVTHLALPIRSVRSTFDSCLDSTLIGVTTAGTPLLNDLASQFTQANETTVVGYTRDGFAVYGPTADPSQLDACGGQYVNGSYQYHVRSDEPFILGCYAGVPSSIDV